MASELVFIQPDRLSQIWHAACSVVPCSLGQVCLALATISPLLAYPFLAHRNRRKTYMPAEFLMDTTRIHMGFHFAVVWFSARDVFNASTAAPVPVNIWPLYLDVFALAASYPARYFSEGNPLHPQDFNHAGRWVCCFLLYILFQAFYLILDRNSAYAFALAALVVYGISEMLTKCVTKHTHAYMTRNISSLGRLCPQRGLDDFDSGWCLALEFAVLLGHFITIPVSLIEAFGDR